MIAVKETTQRKQAAAAVAAARARAGAGAGTAPATPVAAAVASSGAPASANGAAAGSAEKVRHRFDQSPLHIRTSDRGRRRLTLMPNIDQLVPIGFAGWWLCWCPIVECL